MTQSEIEKLGAGRELDILIERRVFGNEFDERGMMKVRPFSTDPAAMMQVIEAMRDKHKRATIIEAFRSGRFQCTMFALPPAKHANAIALTAPVAVCHAALAALAHTQEVKP